MYNWLAEFERFAPELTVPVPWRARNASACSRRREAFEGGGCDVLVTSYDLLRIDAAAWAEHELFCCVLDEAQYIKNPATLTTRAVKRVRARHRFALTGTPMENRLSELWSIFDFLMPGLLGPYNRFRRALRAAHRRRRRGGGTAPAGHRRAVHAAPPKTDVLRELPDKLESIVYAPLEGEQQRLYAAHEQRLREELTAQRKNKNDRSFDQHKVEVLAELATSCSSLCCDPRLLYENYEKGAASSTPSWSSCPPHGTPAKNARVLPVHQLPRPHCGTAHAAGVGYFTITGATPKKPAWRW